MDYCIKLQKQIQRWRNLKPELEEKKKTPFLDSSRPPTPTRRPLRPPNRRGVQIYSECPNTPKSPGQIVSPSNLFKASTPHVYNIPDQFVRILKSNVKESVNVTYDSHKRNEDLNEVLSRTTDKLRDSDRKNASSDLSMTPSAEQPTVLQEENALWRKKLSDLQKKYSQVRGVNSKLSKEVSTLKAGLTEIIEVRMTRKFIREITKWKTILRTCRNI